MNTDRFGATLPAPEPPTPPIEHPTVAIPVQPPLATKKPRRWVKRLGITAMVVFALLAGVGIGAAGSNQTAALNTAQAANGTLRGQITTLHREAGVLQGQTATAQQQAATATATANAKAKAGYATRNAGLNQRSAALDQRNAALDRRARAIAAAEGRLQSSAVPGDGTYVVGQDIKPGVYHTNGSGNAGQNDCYYATLNSTDGSLNSIIANGNFDGSETLTLNGVYAFQIDGSCPWVRVG